MPQNPIALIEFVVFIGFVVWLFTWQNSSRKSDDRQGKQTSDEGDSTEAGGEQQDG